MRPRGFPADRITLRPSIDIIGASQFAVHTTVRGPVVRYTMTEKTEQLAFEKSRKGRSADQRHHPMSGWSWKKETDGRCPGWIGSITFDRGVGFLLRIGHGASHHSHRTTRVPSATCERGFARGGKMVRDFLPDFTEIGRPCARGMARAIPITQTENRRRAFCPGPGAKRTSTDGRAAPGADRP